jgi:hypothetical protein
MGELLAVQSAAVIIACLQPSDLDLSNDGLAREGARGS